MQSHNEKQDSGNKFKSHLDHPLGRSLYKASSAFLQKSNDAPGLGLVAAQNAPARHSSLASQASLSATKNCGRTVPARPSRRASAESFRFKQVNLRRTFPRAALPQRCFVANVPGLILNRNYRSKSRITSTGAGVGTNDKHRKNVWRRPTE